MRGLVICFGLIIVIGCPIVIPFIIVGLIILHISRPDSVTALISWLSGARSSRTAPPEITEEKNFTTYKERQKRNVKEYMKPGYDAWSPENRERTKRIHDLMDRNRRIAQREEQREIERENIEKAKKGIF